MAPADDVVVGVVDLRGDERGVVFLCEIERGQDVGELPGRAPQHYLQRGRQLRSAGSSRADQELGR